MPLKDSALAVAVAIIWGLNFLAIHFGLQDVPPFLFVAIRFVFVAFPLVFFVPRPQVPWSILLAIGVFMSLGQFGLLYLSLDLGMPVGLSSLVLQVQVLVTIGLAWLILSERPSGRQLMGVALGVAGLVVIGLGLGAATPIVPFFICIAAAVSWAFGNVVARSAKIRSGFAVVVWSALVVPIPCFAISWLVEGPDEIRAGFASFGWAAGISTAYTVILSSWVGYALFNSLMARHSAASVVPFILLVPPVGIVSAWIVLGEVPTAIELLGGVVMLVGVAIATLGGRRVSRRGGRRGPTAPEGLASPAN